MAQGEANIWHFGYHAGIDFNSGTAVAIPGYVNTYEGCATICNSSGTLLFATDGVTVYDTNGGVMATGLLGNNSATQSAIIFPDPGNANQYYVFTVGAVGTGGLHYSIVDMTLNSGMGGVTQLNVPLVSPTCEKVTAIYASNGTDVWVICHAAANNQFYAYRITPLGVTSAVITAIGSSTQYGAAFLGYLKASPDGTKLAMVCYGTNANENIFEVYDFNNSSGVLSNVIAVPPITSNLYGVSFSPDNSKLYVSSFSAAIHLIQYDLTVANWWNNPFTVFSSGAFTLGALQTAPDGKIYVAENNSATLSTIDNPNSPGAACNFNLHSFPLINHSAIGLPTFFDQLSSTIPCTVNLGSDQTFCGNFSVTLNAGAGDSTFLWSDGSTDQSLTVTAAGTYWVIKTLSTGCVASDTVTILQHPLPLINLGNDTAVCHAGTVSLNAGAGFQSYLWNNGYTTQIITPHVSDTFSVQVTDTNGCIGTDTIVFAIHGPQFSIGNDTTVCLGDSVLLNPGSIYKTYIWSTGTFDSLNMVYGAGTYSVTVFDFQGCYASDTIVVSVSLPQVDLGNDTLLCGTINYTLNAGAGFAQYHWSNNSTNASLIIHAAGTFAVSVTDQTGCKAADTINIFNSDPHIELGNDTTICIHTSVELNAPPGFASYEWNNGNSSSHITVTAVGFYSITVTDTLGCEAFDSKSILIDNPKVFIGNDTSNCNGAGIVFDAGNNFNSYLWNNNSTQPDITSTDAGIYSVTVTDVYSCTASDTAVVSYNDCLEINVPTAFSPNGDGHNDFFHILNSFHFKSGEMKIYNRWGELVYETTDLNGHWNGKYNNRDCEVGVYVFVITGKNFLNHSVIKTGNVSLLR